MGRNRKPDWRAGPAHARQSALSHPGLTVDKSKLGKS